MRVIVCGCRDWTDSSSVGCELDDLRDYGSDTELVIVHGACKHWDKPSKRWVGADQFADDWCVARGVKQEKHPADWSKHGNAAGPIRNQEMAKLGAELCLAFWDSVSKGTLNMIVCATRARIPVRIVPRKL